MYIQNICPDLPAVGRVLHLASVFPACADKCFLGACPARREGNVKKEVQRSVKKIEKIYITRALNPLPYFTNL